MLHHMIANKLLVYSCKCIEERSTSFELKRDFLCRYSMKGFGLLGGKNTASRFSLIWKSRVRFHIV